MAQIGKAPSDHTLILHGARAEEGACPEASKPWVLAAAVVGSSMAFIDGTVVNVALPAIQADLLATAFQAQWVVESYALLLAALLLVGARWAITMAGGASLRSASASSPCLRWPAGLRPTCSSSLRRARCRASAVRCWCRAASRSSARPFPRKSVARPSARGRASAASPRPWGRCWAASWSITSRGPGLFSSTCRWHCWCCGSSGATCPRAEAHRPAAGSTCGALCWRRPVSAASSTPSSRRRRKVGVRRPCLRRWSSACWVAWVSSQSSARCERRCCRWGCCASATSAEPIC